MSSFEVEIKLRLNDFLRKRFESFFNKYSLLPIKEERLVDVYFNHPYRNFSESDEVLRVRKTLDYVLLTYKGPRVKGRSKTREELEVRISDFDTIILILRRIGFDELIRIEKIRKTYVFNKFKICIDKVVNLGLFAEIEVACNNKDEIKNIENEIYRFLKTEISDDVEKYIEPKTYLELILERDE